MDVCLVNDTSDDPNLGAIATSRALRELIHEAGGSVTSTLYQYRIGVAQTDDTLEASQEVRDIAPSEWAAFDECAARVMAGEWFPWIYQALNDCDAVLINGEGCIFDCTRQSRMIYFIAYLAKRYLGKCTAIVNHSIVMNDPVLVEIAANVYPCLDDIVYREPDSATACPGIRGHVGADAAYIYAPQPLAEWSGPHLGHFDPERPYVCVGGGSVFFRGVRPDHDPIPDFIRLCERFRQQMGQVVLTASSHKDLHLMTPVSRELGLPLIGTDDALQATIDVLGHATAYIGARWHPSIFAHRGGTPVITWTEHTPKMTAFLRQAELPLTTFDPFRIEAQLDDILRLANTYLEEGDALRKRLRTGAQRLEHRARDNVRILE